MYSYGPHFPIARHYKGAVLFTTRSYSVTTARHISITHSACHHLPVFHVGKVTDEPSKATLAEYSARIELAALTAARARKADSALSQLERIIEEANRFAEHFGFKTRFSAPANLAELKAKAAASSKREREAKAARQAKLEAEAAETIQKWLAGESVTIPHFVGGTFLRAVEDQMQTSRGARVPLDQAKLAFRFAQSKRESGWHRNGETFKIGDYNLDSVNAQGVIAGCHRVTWAEIERFAATQGW